MMLAVQFKDGAVVFEEEMVAFGCEPSVCTRCNWTPSAFQIDIVGVINNICSDCDDANGTFVAEFDPAAACYWSYTRSFGHCGIPPPGSPITTLTVYVGYGDVIGYYVSVTYNCPALSQTFGWWKIYGGTKPNCSAFDQEEIPYVQYGLCDTRPSTCVLTAIP